MRWELKSLRAGFSRGLVAVRVHLSGVSRALSRVRAESTSGQTVALASMALLCHPVPHCCWGSGALGSVCTQVLCILVPLLCPPLSGQASGEPEARGLHWPAGHADLPFLLLGTDGYVVSGFQVVM